MHVALIGTRGVPARYGGFETAVEEIGRRLVERQHEVTVFCRGVKGFADPTYLGMNRVTLPAVRQRSLETLSHTAFSVVHSSLRSVDSAILFNAGNAPLLPVLKIRRIPVATHVDGLEWKRAKWGALGRRYYRVAEALAVAWSDALIADAQGIADYYEDRFGARTRLIAYGAPIIRNPGTDRLTELGLEPHAFHLVVARFEPENHVLEIVRGYSRSHARLPLVVVGSAPYSAGYASEIKEAAGSGVRLLGAVWDQAQLDQLYANALTYLHGHCVGGTNPSLLRAAGAGAPVVAFDVGFNREVVGNDGWYFATEDGLARTLELLEADPESTMKRGAALRQAITRYNWDDVTDSYEALLADLVAQPARGPLGRQLP